MDDRARRVEAALEWPLFVAALLIIPVIVIEESKLPATWSTIAQALNWLSWGAFASEMAIMLSVVPNRRQWLRDHPLEVAIVFLTPPVLPASLEAARAFRLLRLLRLVRAAKVARRAFSLEGLRYAAVLVLVTLLGGGAMFSAVEAEHHQQGLTAWDGLWWAITTVTTVGYGDITPATSMGRIIGVVVMAAGIGFVALLTAEAAQRFIAPTIEETEEDVIEHLGRPEDVIRHLEDISARLARLEERSKP